MSTAQLGPTGSYINLYPNYDYEFIKTLERQDVRTKAGNLYTYVDSGNWYSFKLPLSWVNSSDRSLVNSWWENATDLLFFENSDQSSVYYNVRIVGKEEPFNSFVRPYFQIYYEGEIVLETI